MCFYWKMDFDIFVCVGGEGLSAGITDDSEIGPLCSEARSLWKQILKMSNRVRGLPSEENGWLLIRYKVDQAMDLCSNLAGLLFIFLMFSNHATLLCQCCCFANWRSAVVSLPVKYERSFMSIALCATASCCGDDVVKMPGLVTYRSHTRQLEKYCKVGNLCSENYSVSISLQYFDFLQIFKENLTYFPPMGFASWAASIQNQCAGHLSIMAHKGWGRSGSSLI